MGDTVTDVDAQIVEPASTELVIAQIAPLPAIEANVEAVRAHIESLVADYKDLVVTEEYVAQAKKDRAYLNSLSTSLTQRFREAKRRYMEPVDVLDRQIKELDVPIREASAAIDEQVKAFEALAKVAKRAELVKHWGEFAGVLADAVPFERIENPAWANQSFSLMKAFEEIEATVERIAREDAAIDGLKLSHPIEAKAEYLATLDMAAAIARSKALDDQEERARRLEAEKAAIAMYAQQASPVPSPVPVAEPAPTPPAQAVAPVAPTERATEPIAEWTLTLQCTRTELESVIGYLEDHGITGKASR